MKMGMVKGKAESEQQKLKEPVIAGNKKKQ
jgi:hypothetical protein